MGASPIRCFGNRNENIQEYHQLREDDPNGFVLHIRSKKKDDMYHKADCGQLDHNKPMKIRRLPGRFRYTKICSESKQDLEEWLAKNRPNARGRDGGWCLI